MNRAVTPSEPVMQLAEDYFEKFSQSRIDVFLAAYRRMAKTIPSERSQSAERHYHSARLMETMDLGAWAIRCYRAAIAENPTDPSPYYALAALYSRLGLPYSMKKAYRDLLRASPELPGLQAELMELDRRFPNRTVSFYLPCYNVARYVEATLSGVLAQSYPIAEILIVDDGSTDETIRIANRFPVKVITHPANRGLAAARNTALKHAAGEFIASVDTDAVPDPCWLERLMLNFTSEEMAGVGGKLIEKNTATAVDRWRQIILKQDYGNLPAENVNLYGCNTVFRVKALRRIGGYDEYYRTNFEDMDLCTRLLKSGYRTCFNPLAVCRHHRVDTLASAANTIYHWQRPAWETAGSYQHMGMLTRKILQCLRDGIQKVVTLVDTGRFETLYVSFLSTIRTLLKDISAFQTANPGTPMRPTFLAAFLAVIHLVKRHGNFSDQFAEWLLDDIADTVPESLGIDPGVQLSVFKRGVLGEVERHPKLTALFDAHHLAGKTQEDFLLAVLECLKPLLVINPMIAAMIQTSARRIRHEAEHSPYAHERRVMLLNPPWKIGNRRGVRAGSRWPFTFEQCRQPGALSYTPYPFFIGYLSSILKTRQIGNVIVDGIAEDLTHEEFIERVAGYEPEIIVMEISTASFRTDVLWLLKIRERLPRVKVIWVGPHATALGENIIRENPLVDFVVQGEYEQAAADLIDRLLAGRDFSDLKGLVTADADGKIINTGRADLIADLDALPWPERLTVPIYKYNDLFAGMRYPSLQIHGSRGCPFGCIYCVWPQVLYGGKVYRARRPEAIMDELEQVVREYGFNSVYFDDDTFNIGKKRILDLCREFDRRNLTIPWGAMARADTSDFETLRAMKNAGMVGIKFGVESGVQGLVDSAEKGLDLFKVGSAVEWCRQLGIKTHLTFTFGLPGETHATIKKTVEFAKRMNPDSIQFSITTPFPGTKYFKLLKESGNLLSEDWDQFDGARYTVIRTDALTQADLQAALNLANSEYHHHKRTAAGVQCPAEPKEVAA